LSSNFSNQNSIYHVYMYVCLISTSAEVLKQCWSLEHHERPSFKVLMQELRNHAANLPKTLVPRQVNIAETVCSTSSASAAHHAVVARPIPEDTPRILALHWPNPDVQPIERTEVLQISGACKLCGLRAAVRATVGHDSHNDLTFFAI
jgi:hypothetical protein